MENMINVQFIFLVHLLNGDAQFHCISIYSSDERDKAVVLKLHKEYIPICMECLNDKTPDVRDASFSALATITKSVGMRPLERSFEKLDEVRKKKLTEMIASSEGGLVPTIASEVLQVSLDLSMGITSSSLLRTSFGVRGGWVTSHNLWDTILCCSRGNPQQRL